MLNAVSKDLGSSRAKEAHGTFILTNSVIYTRNLEIHSPPARLHYDGTVDFVGNVNANIEAEMFRDTFLVGPLISLLTTPVTKVFEYRVTGSLANPRSEPRFFIPKLFLLPLRPSRPSASSSRRTNRDGTDEAVREPALSSASRPHRRGETSAELSFRRRILLDEN